MNPFSKKLFYAIEAVLYIAYNANQHPVSGKEIAARQGMAARYLEQMMQNLVHAGVLRGVRGPHGGYLLAREKRRITLADISEALAEEESIPSSTPLGNQIVMPALQKLQDSITQQLGNITVAALYDLATERRIRKSNDERNDFAI